MRLLLDTNIYVYMISDQKSLSNVLNDPSVDIDNTDVNVIRTLAALHVNEEQDHKDPFDHIIIAQAISHKMASFAYLCTKCTSSPRCAY